jgi:hypothetical protein
MKDKFDKLVATIKSSRAYTAAIKRDPAMLAFAEEFTKLHGTENFNEVTYCVVNSMIPKRCPCGNKILFNSYDKGYRKFCAPDCDARKKAQAAFATNMWKDEEKKATMIENKNATMIAVYGAANPMEVPEIRAKIEATCLTNHGATSPFGSESIKEKIMETNMANLGVAMPFQSAEIREKANQTFIKNHGNINKMYFARKAFADQNGGLNPFQVPEIKLRIKQVLIEKYGVDHPMKSPDFVKKSQATCFKNYGRISTAQLHIPMESIEILNDKDKLSHLFETMSLTEMTNHLGITRPYIMRYHDMHELTYIPKRVLSSYEEEIATILDGLGIEYTRNNKSLCKPYHIDFYIPAHKLGIEFNGLYYHSWFAANRGAEYHSNKTVQCLSSDVSLVTIFEDEWLENPVKFIDFIKQRCGMGNADLPIDLVTLSFSDDSEAVLKFFKDNNMESEIESADMYIVAKLEDSIIAAMAIDKRDGGEVEIVKFGVHLLISPDGYLERFISYIASMEEVNRVSTILDLRWQDGRDYLAVGFDATAIMDPVCYATDYHNRWYTTDTVDTYIRDKSVNKDLIWDCGHLQLTLEFSDETSV